MQITTITASADFRRKSEKMLTQYQYAWLKDHQFPHSPHSLLSVWYLCIRSLFFLYMNIYKSDISQSTEISVTATMEENKGKAQLQPRWRGRRRARHRCCPCRPGLRSDYRGLGRQGAGLTLMLDTFNLKELPWWLRR